MVGAVQSDIVVDLRDQIKAVAGQERQDRVKPLLQMPVRINEAVQVRGIGGGALVPAHQFSSYFSLDLGKLIGDLLPASLGDGRQRGIERLQLAAQMFNRTLRSCLGF